MSLILLLVLVVLVFGVAYGLYTVRGSGISESPYGGRHSPPNAEEHSDATGIDRTEGSATGSDAEGTSDPQHGTR